MVITCRWPNSVLILEGIRSFTWWSPHRISSSTRQISKLQKCCENCTLSDFVIDVLSLSHDLVFVFDLRILMFFAVSVTRLLDVVFFTTNPCLQFLWGTAGEGFQDPPSRSKTCNRLHPSLKSCCLKEIANRSKTVVGYHPPGLRNLLSLGNANTDQVQGPYALLFTYGDPFKKYIQ